MPIADDATTPAPTIKPPPKPKKTKKATPPRVYGPVAPTVAASPSRVSKTTSAPPPKQGPVQQTQSPIAPYTDNIFNRRKAPIIDTSKIKPTVKGGKSSNDLSDFLTGLSRSSSDDIFQSSTGSIRTDAYEGPDPDEDSALDRLMSFRQADIAAGDGSGVVGRREDIQNFLQKIMPQNYDPEYGGVRMPEAWKHKGNDLNKPLKPHWDAEEIASNLSDFAPGSSFARFAMNDILEKQLRNQSNWVKRQTVTRAYRLQDTLKEAQDAAFDGDFDYLSEKLKKNPDLLEFARYRDDYTITPDDVWNQWEQDRNQYSGDEYVKGAMRARTDDLKSHYEYVQGYYQQSRQIANRAIRKYETSYDRSVEFAEKAGGKKAQAASEAGPAIPDTDDKSALDAVGNAFPEDKGSARFLGDREEAKRRLGVDKLPSVRDMLAALVSQGQIDPDSDAEVAAWINRLQNPNHPDTRAMYVAFARNQNKDLDLEGDALDYINEPINRYISQEETKAQVEAEKAAEATKKSQDIAVNAVDDILKTGLNPANWGDSSAYVEDIANAAEETEAEGETASVKGANSLFWTFDKLARASYAVAGATDAWYRLDQDEAGAPKPWYQKWILGDDPISWLSGKNLADSTDEWNENKIGSTAKVGVTAYEQFFRGSDLPGVREDVVPITFSQVIANNALWDPEDNRYDKEWYQHTAGFALDVGLDPLNFVGVGVVNNTLKTPVEIMKQASRLGKSAADDAVLSSRLLRELNNPNLSPAQEKAWRVDQVLARQGDYAQGDAIISEPSINRMEYTVEYGDYGGTVGKVNEAPVYTNARYFANTRVDGAEIRRELAELAAVKKEYPKQVALESYRKELQNLVDELDLAGGDLIVPEIRIRTLMEQNATPIKIEGVKNLKLNNPGGLFWREVLDKDLVENTIAKWPQHKSKTRFAQFTDEAGKTRLTQRAAAARRALDEEETFYRQGSVAPDEAVGRWNTAIDDAYENRDMWQEYDVEHWLDEGAPGLFSAEAEWTPLKAYAHAASVTPEKLTAVKGWTNEDIIRSLHRGPKMLAKQDSEYAQRLRDAQDKIKYAKAKLANPQINSSGRTSAYTALKMAYRDMSQATLEGSFRYLDGDTFRIPGSAGPEADKASRIDGLLSQLDEVDTDTALADEMPGLPMSSEYDQMGGTGYQSNAYRTSDGTYKDIDPDEYDSIEDMLDSVDSAEFPSKQAQVEALRRELEDQRSALNEGVYSDSREFKNLSEAEVVNLDRILPIQSQFRKGDGFDTEAISRHLSHNREDISEGTKDVFKVSWKLEEPKDKTSVAFARYQREAKFLDLIAKEIETKADDLFKAENKAMKDAKRVDKPESEALQRAQDDLSSFWTKGKDGREGPAVRKLGPRPTLTSISDELAEKYPAAFAKVKEQQVATRNKKRNPEAKIDVNQETGTHTNVKWDFATGMSKTKEGRQIEAVLKSRQRQWDKAVKTAQETDAARHAELKAEVSNLKQVSKDHQLTQAETQTLYKRTYGKAKQSVFDHIADTRTLLANRANSRLTIAEQSSALQREAASRIKFEELKLKIAKAETDIPEELAALERRRKELIKKKIALYDRVKKIKLDSNTVRLTMMHRIGEDELAQALDMPERIDRRALQVSLFGMKKNLQFTSSMFRGAEFAEQFLPASVWAKFQDTWFRPTKQLNSIEAIEARAMWEGKTPVVIHSLQKKLTKAMANTDDSERSAMLMAYRKGVPYGGPKQLEFQNVTAQLDELMDIINGVHPAYMFKEQGKTTAKALTVYDLLRFLPEQYAPSIKVLHRGGETGKVRPKEGAPDPFAPTPEPNSNYSFDDLMNAIEANGKATPKDLIDPFRVAWVYNLAAGQASTFKAFTKTVANFGVTRPENAAKARLWREFETKHGWQEIEDIPNVLFPPEAVKEVQTLMKFTRPGPEQTEFMKVIDQGIGYWKQGMTIYNPAYYTRNGIGEMMVSWLDGVNSPKWYAKSNRVLRYVKNTDQDKLALVQKYDVLEGKIPIDVAKGNEVLFSLKGGQKIRIEDVYKEYVDQGLMSTFANTDIGRGVRGLANQSLTTNPFRRGAAKVNNKVHEVGEGFEDYLRLAHFMHAMEKSGKGSVKEAARYAAQRVRRSHFDYTDFSDFEKTVMLRAFPFYKWIRRGAPLMMQHLFMTPGKMIAAPKALDYMSNMGFDPLNVFNEGPVLDTQDVYEDKNGYLPNYSGIAPAFVRDLFAYQMQPAEDDEYANFFRVALPQFDGLQGLLSFGEGNFGDSTAYTLMNPGIKAPIELARNERLDPDSNFPIVGGEFNEAMGINDTEATGAYLAQQANPWTAFLAKLSKNGKLPDGLNISSGESNRDATRDVLSFFSGMGLYQAKLAEFPESPTAVGNAGVQVGVPDYSGRAASRTTKPSSNENALKKLVETNTNTTSGEDVTGDSGKGWIDYQSNGKSRWIPNKYGRSRGYSGGGFGGLDIMALLRSLREGVDQGRVIDLEAFDAE